MPEVILAEHSGFCFGVQRAVDMTYKLAESGEKVATLGPLIHNEDVTADLGKMGVRIIHTPEELNQNEVVVIRSHGVGKDAYQMIERSGERMADATCPFVARIQKLVEKHSEQEDVILIAGDENHPEVQGIIGHCVHNKCHCFMSESELIHLLNRYEGQSIILVAQTTFNISLWKSCLNVVPDSPRIKVYSTICDATHKRQAAAEELSKTVDLMLVVGGKHSSNTLKLYDVCRKNCRTSHIENARELSQIQWNGASRIGITAGASTPANILKEVFDYVRKL